MNSVDLEVADRRLPARVIVVRGAREDFHLHSNIKINFSGSYRPPDTV